MTATARFRMRTCGSARSRARWRWPHPLRWAGRAPSSTQLAEVLGAIGYGCPATALVLSMQYIQQRQAGRAGSSWPEALARKLVKDAVERGALINALRVEPELGSPARGGLPATVATRTPDGWRISLARSISTGSPALRWLAVWARTDEAAARVGTFLVRADDPGVLIEDLGPPRPARERQSRCGARRRAHPRRSRHRSGAAGRDSSQGRGFSGGNDPAAGGDLRRRGPCGAGLAGGVLE